jgi:hypothetical protein
LRNEEWFQFLVEFRRLATDADPTALDIDALFAVFVALLEQADGLLEQIPKSSETAVIGTLDAERDRIWSGFTEAVRSASRHFLPERRDDAAVIARVVDHYGDITHRSYSEETAALYNLIQELRASAATPLQQLGLTPWIDELERINGEFQEAVIRRTRENAAKPEIGMVDIRRQTDEAWNGIIRRIEALATVHSGAEPYGAFIRTLNAHVERYRNILSRRQAGSQKDGGNENETPAP